MIQVRRRVFVGCEGESERSYCRWLQRRAEELDVALHLDAHVIGGGDPLAVVKGSVSKLRERTRVHGAYAQAAVIFDTDKLGIAPNRDSKIDGICVRNGLHQLRQVYEHEALLLRHFEKCDKLRPPAGSGEAQLLKVWPNYEKPQDALALERKIGLPDLCRMFDVEPDFEKFFRHELRMRRR
jgi:hypothetical protein